MQGSHHFSFPPLSKSNKIIIAILVCLFVVHSAVSLSGNGGLVGIFGLHLNKILGGHLYQLVTFPFMATGLFEVIFDGMILWFLGGDIERMWGARKYLLRLLASCLGGGFLFLILQFFGMGTGQLLYGPASLVYPLMVYYALYYPERPLYLYFFPVKAKYFCMILVAMQIYLGIFGGLTGTLGHIGAMAVAFLIYFLFDRSGGVKFKKRNTNSKHLKLVKDEDNTPKYWH